MLNQRQCQLYNKKEGTDHKTLHLSHVQRLMNPIIFFYREKSIRCNLE